MYCTVGDVGDFLRMDFDGNSKPSKKGVEKIIRRKTEYIDYVTKHSWLPEGRQYTEINNLNYNYTYTRGMPIFLKHRNILDYDPTKGDKIEAWSGTAWLETANNFNFVNERGTLYLKGFLYSIARMERIRVTYRYGGENETFTDAEGNKTTIPPDIEDACVLLTAVDILSTDFTYSTIPYGGEGQIDKSAIMRMWTTQAMDIIDKHKDMLTVY